MNPFTLKKRGRYQESFHGQQRCRTPAAYMVVEKMVLLEIVLLPKSSIDILLVVLRL
jgi:hypothetical protein